VTEGKPRGDRNSLRGVGVGAMVGGSLGLYSFEGGPFGGWAGSIGREPTSPYTPSAH
jgi:hypothetical protein